MYFLLDARSYIQLRLFAYYSVKDVWRAKAGPSFGSGVSRRILFVGSAFWRFLATKIHYFFSSKKMSCGSDH